MTSNTPLSDADHGHETRVALRVREAERDLIARLARAHDRTLSSEIRRAIRFYLTNFDIADRALREQASKTDVEA